MNSGKQVVESLEVTYFNKLLYENSKLSIKIVSKQKPKLCPDDSLYTSLLLLVSYLPFDQVSQTWLYRLQYESLIRPQVYI